MVGNFSKFSLLNSAIHIETESVLFRFFFAKICYFYFKKNENQFVNCSFCGLPLLIKSWTVIGWP
jgi:hypothetical protein